MLRREDSASISSPLTVTSSTSNSAPSKLEEELDAAVEAVAKDEAGASGVVAVPVLHLE